ncbi:XRE family transcriptional regulator, partial [Erysipelatoclostridium ramosum]|nr:XRE family transcriptional regulator [Thomasclavelia ramosa]
LYLNHYMLHEKPEQVMKRSEELCDRVIAESEENNLVKDAISLKITYLIASHQPQKALQLLGEEAKPIVQDSEMIAACYQ